MNAIVLQHEEEGGLGLLEPALRAAGYTVVTRFRTVKYEDTDAALVVVLGGYMGAYETDAHPFLNHEIALLSQRLAANRPNLGICLGAQVLARAAGAEVFRGKNGFEVGIAPVRWTAAAQEDLVLRHIRPKQVFAHWHGDTYAPVPGATLLASTDRYSQQAFRLGRSYGFQFHPELTAEILGGWYETEADALRSAGKDPAELRKDLGKLKAAQPECEAFLERLVQSFR